MGRHHEEDTVRLQPPVDPWPDAHDGFTQPIPVSGVRTRRAYGYVYEVITGDQRDGLHPYAGQTTTTIHQRVHGPNGHTSPASIAKDPWKARIRPGRAGYRCLKVIYATDNPGADQVRLDMAEAFAIDELRTTHNDRRPVRPPSTAAPAPRKPRAERRPVKVPWRLVGFLLVWASLSTIAGALAGANHLPIWVGIPVVLIPAWRVFLRLHRVGSWLAGNPVPRQPTSRRRPRPARRRRRR